MTNETFKEVLLKAVADYAPQAAERVERNRHMNAYRGFRPDVESWLRPWLTRFAERCVESNGGSDSISRVGDYLVSAAKAFRREIVDGSSQELLDALLVDFINYIFDKRCIDYGLYTSDLAKE